MNIISFFVEGEPRAKQSFRSLGRRGGYTPRYIKAWQNKVACIAQATMHLAEIEPLEGNLSVELTFFLGDCRKIDSDNLSKAVLDGLNGITWTDDRQVIDLKINKYVCRERSGVLAIIKENTRPLEVTLKQQEIMTATAWYGVMLEPQHAKDWMPA